MTPFPHSVAATAGLAEAKAMLDEHRIRHLPVCEGHTLIGIVSEHDLRVRHSDLATVADVCTRDPYVVELDTPLDVVVATMAERQVTATLIVRFGKLVGILTTTDVCRLLAEHLRGQVVEDDDVA